MVRHGEIDDLLRKLYYDPITGYTGVDPLVVSASRLLARKVPRNVVTEWLRGEKTYFLHRPAIERGNWRNKILSKGIDYVWQSDLVEVQPLARYNNGYRYLITIIDTFSRYAWVRPLKTKSGSDVAQALEDVFRTSRRKPQKLCTDMGKEYENQEVHRLMSKHNIILYYSC